jgi:hypothetical protein
LLVLPVEVVYALSGWVCLNGLITN